MTPGTIEAVGRQVAATQGLDADQLLRGRPFAAACGAALVKLPPAEVVAELARPIGRSANPYGMLIARLRHLADTAPAIPKRCVVGPISSPLPPSPSPEVRAEGLRLARAALATAATPPPPSGLPPAPDPALRERFQELRARMRTRR